jgi:hypothetical protein
MIGTLRGLLGHAARLKIIGGTPRKAFGNSLAKGDNGD